MSNAWQDRSAEVPAQDMYLFEGLVVGMVLSRHFPLPHFELQRLQVIRYLVIAPIHRSSLVLPGGAFNIDWFSFNPITWIQAEVLLAREI